MKEIGVNINEEMEKIDQKDEMSHYNQRLRV